MFLAYDNRYGIFWAIPHDLTSKTRVHPDNRGHVEAGWAGMELKWYGPVAFHPDMIDGIPDVAAAKPFKVEGTVVHDLIGDGQGAV